MISPVGLNRINLNSRNTLRNNVQRNTNVTAPSFENKNLSLMLRAYNSPSFGQGLANVLQELKQPMRTCYDPAKGNEGQEAGIQYNVSKLIDRYASDLPNYGDAVVTVQKVKKDGDMLTEAYTKLERMENGILYEMAIRQPRDIHKPLDKSKEFSAVYDIAQSPYINERAYVLNTRGNLMAVVEEDDDLMLLTNAGYIRRKGDKEALEVNVENSHVTKYEPFTPRIQRVESRIPMESVGEGTEIVIGLEDGRFVEETIADIEDFIDKINNEEIVLKQFVASDDAKKSQIALLAGGYSTRAEFANAASPAIFHGILNGPQTTKGIFHTATGLSPMGTMFITLHNAGLLDCSKGKLEIGKNIKLYLNMSGKNNGNGGFTLDLYRKMARDNRENLMIVPNDPMSRMTNAFKTMQSMINSGDAAMVLIAKKVSSEDAKGKFGIMKISPNSEILEFAEKPKEIPDGYTVDGNQCLTNTFQFAVSKESFEALDIFEKYMASNDGKDLRDWSKHFVPILMTLTQNDDNDVIREKIAKVLNISKDSISYEDIISAKQILGNQKIYAVPTNEPWADCGSFNDLYLTTMQIASGDFPLEDFERKHVLDSIDTQSGLVASDPIQKALIQKKYTTVGQVMVVPIAKPIRKNILNEYNSKGKITINEG